MSYRKGDLFQFHAIIHIVKGTPYFITDPLRLLVVEDDRALARMLSVVLREEGYAVDVAHHAEDARALAFSNEYDAILLDLGLPDGNGLRVIQELRREGGAAPILVLTGEADRQMVVRALDAGADDYLTKPAFNAEIVARLRALIRRGGSSRTETLSAGALVMNRLSREVLVAGSPIVLTAHEFNLLEQLLLHPGEVVRRSDLLEKVWDLTFDPSSNVIDVHVSRLRRKLQGAGSPVEIRAVRGVGYKLVVMD
jgi:DNA-binding response OmpR family regulator